MVSERYQVEVVGDSYYKRVISCQNACPAHIDVQGCVNTIASGDYEDGYIMVSQPNILASTCARVFNYPCYGSIFYLHGIVPYGPAHIPLVRLTSSTE